MPYGGPHPEGRRRAGNVLARARPLIDGHDIIDVFSLEPGPAVGAMLETVREAQAAGEVGSKEEALELVREKLNVGDDGA